MVSSSLHFLLIDHNKKWKLLFSNNSIEPRCASYPHSQIKVAAEDTSHDEC